uniref:Uncharacterized protein n=1 Tax=Periophthalmus magnuspinnatus TaxID=409849 RepID=A0A3B4AMT0_9GOBI
EYPTCGANEFRCANGRCLIQSSWECDGDFDCHDRSDEAPKNPHSEVTCAPNQFQCSITKRCIPRVWVCDRDNDCVDGSDEPANCMYKVCGEGIYITEFHKCVIIMLSFVCLAQMTCGVDEFRCKDSGRCIPARWKCDGEDDCGDASDEPKEECGKSSTIKDERTCEPYQFRCKNNRCVPGRWQCDYDNDCGDNSDEDKCGMGLCFIMDYNRAQNHYLTGSNWHIAKAVIFYQGFFPVVTLA